MRKDAEITEELRLARRAAQGDRVALSTLYHGHADLLFAFISHRVPGDRQDAEDVFQETWLAAMRSLATYRGENRIFTWLCGIARHKIADFGFRRERRLGREEREAPSGSLREFVDEGPLPEQVVTDIETRVRVVEALARLPGDYRTALLARYVEDLSVETIARRLGRTYKATESLLSRARGALREALISVPWGQDDERP